MAGGSASPASGAPVSTLPVEVVRIEATPRAARVAGERKPVTAMFADVVGSTTLAEQLDPEDWAEAMNAAFDVMSAAIQRYEGTISQLLGDGVLAFFGAPVPHEDDPERAVRAALELVTSLRAAHIRPLGTAGEVDLVVRVGINTGLVVVGDMGRRSASATGSWPSRPGGGASSTHSSAATSRRPRTSAPRTRFSRSGCGRRATSPRSRSGASRRP